MLVPFVGTDNVGNLIIATSRISFGTAGPEQSCAQQDFGTIITEEDLIIGDTPVLPDGVRNAGRNMQFDEAVQDRDDLASLWMDNGWWGSLLTVQRAFPGILRPLITKAPRFFAGRIEETVAIEEKIASDIRHNIS